MLSTPLFFNLHPHHFAHNKQGNHIQDFSSYLLFEATGDSEADPSEGSPATPNSTELNYDAESCTDDTPFLCDEFVIDSNEDGDEDGDEEEGNEMLENENDDEVVESKKRPFVFTTKPIDSTKEFKMLNEVDKNKLFWEACLAS